MKAKPTPKNDGLQRDFRSLLCVAIIVSMVIAIPCCFVFIGIFFLMISHLETQSVDASFWKSLLIVLPVFFALFYFGVIRKVPWHISLLSFLFTLFFFWVVALNPYHEISRHPRRCAHRHHATSDVEKGNTIGERN